MKAVVTRHPNWPQVFTGEMITLKCEVPKGQPEDWWYDWYEDDYPLDVNTQEITFEPDQIPDNGTYKCMGTNKKNQNLEVKSKTYNMPVLGECHA